MTKQIRSVTLGPALKKPQTNSSRTHAGEGTVGVGVAFVAHAEGTVAQQQNGTDEQEEKGSPVLLEHSEDIIRQLQEHYNHVKGILLHCDEF